MLSNLEGFWLSVVLLGFEEITRTAFIEDGYYAGIRGGLQRTAPLVLQPSQNVSNNSMSRMSWVWCLGCLEGHYRRNVINKKPKTYTVATCHIKFSM